MILTLRNPFLLAKQISTLSWLTERPFAFGVGSGWLREEYDAVGMPFEKRGARAKAEIDQIKELLMHGKRSFLVRDDDDALVEREFVMSPRAPASVEFLWGGVSPVAMRLVASCCDGWLPSKQTFADLECHLAHLRRACDEARRDFHELKLIVKVGPGPDPPSGGIDRDNLARYVELGFHEVILELPNEPAGVLDAVQDLERVAERSWR
jgi:alkanesulfonate monooxygenase SsuD/methylene tetrahydromethanopterin reductase-like flavin-dependent oxidoreductase (luciferase family)